MNRPRVIDLIDILLLAVLFYQLLMHVRSTHISQMFKGIAILVAATWISGLLGMRAIHALLSWMINAGPVLLIVLFQNEVKLILEQLGNSGMFDRQERTAGTEQLIDEIVLAISHMAHRRVGALIVIEQGIRLNDVAATGTAVDGLVTQPLLENIFEPNTPLHDGAVLVRGDRVVSAACLLRLSDNTGVGRDLGTRHRAALGMSEVSDAKVLVVSEETGIVSMAEGGRLTRHLDEKALRQILHGIYGRQEREEDSQLSLFRLSRRRRSGHDEQN